MDTPRPTLLQAAKAFVAKSTKAAAVIAPLALAAVPTEVEAQAVFGPATFTTASVHAPSGGGSKDYAASSWFTQALAPRDGFAGQQFGANYTFTDLPSTGSELQAVIEIRSSSGSSGSLPKFSLVPFAYQFSLSFSEGITLEYLSINGVLSGQDGMSTEPTMVSGTDFTSGIISGAGTFEIDYGYGDVYSPLVLLDDAWVVQLTLQFSAASTTDWINVSMNNSDGFALGSDTLAAVPEPSTYAMLFALTALGYAAYRRRRAA